MSSIRSSHSYSVTCVDYNPNRPDFLCSGGQDAAIKFWDLRFPKVPYESEGGAERILEGHDHWLRSVRYNRFHDQLVCSGGTDHAVNLWRVSSVSSAPLLKLTDDDPDSRPENLPDIRVDKFEDHDESVMGVEWSAADAWCFASVAWDGKVVINHVESEEKYRILL